MEKKDCKAFSETLLSQGSIHKVTKEEFWEHIHDEQLQAAASASKAVA